MPRETRLFAAAVVLLLAGCGDGGRSSAAPASGPVGNFRVEGHVMHIECRGQGRPTVVLDAGLGVEARSTWAGVAPAVARIARTCFYDRPGTGASQRAPGPRTSAAMVRELGKLLRRARVPPPYVLVGASHGGLNAQLFASTRPQEVAGLVLVDAIHPDFDRRFAEVMGRRAARERATALGQNAERVRYRDLLASDREVRRAWPLPRVPIRVLVHGISFEPGGEPVPRLERLWRRLAADLAAAGDGEVIVARRSHHRIAEDEPKVVVEAIRDVLEATGSR